MKHLTIYLAGAIRDNHDEDWEWREYAIEKLSPYACILNPLAGKQFDRATGKWTMNGETASARTIVKQDFWCVDRCDAILFNFLSLAEGYASIGTLTEWGRATGTGALLYPIVKEKYTGHQNQSMYQLHPFIEENATNVFFDAKSAVDFLARHFTMLTGDDPHFKGVV